MVPENERWDGDDGILEVPDEPDWFTELTDRLSFEDWGADR